MKIAIDGPAGSGKSSIARILSKRLWIPYLETGLAYRAVGFLLLMREGEKEEVSWEEVEPLLSRIRVEPGLGETFVYVEGRPVTEELKSEKVGRMASLIGTLPKFREHINARFREIIGDRQMIVEGRDAGTNIVPDAEVKLFITASAEERARRRVRQLRELGVEADYEEILSQIRERDRRDSERKDYPLRPAEDAVVVDTTGLSLEEAVEKVLSLLTEMER